MGGEGLMAIRRRDQKRGAGPRFPQAGGGGRAGPRGQGPGATAGAQDSASCRMRARPAALEAEESASCPPSLPSPPLTCPSEFLGLHEEHICEHICLLLHASLRQIIGTYAADVACDMNGKAPNTSQHNPKQRVQRVHREQEI